MISYYIHPSDGRQMRVSKLSHWRGSEDKPFLTHAAWIDLPGAWDESRWNLHYDGCDYQFDSMKECLDLLVSYDSFELVGNKYVEAKFELVFTPQPYIDGGWQQPYKAYKDFKF